MSAVASGIFRRAASSSASRSTISRYITERADRETPVFSRVPSLKEEEEADPQSKNAVVLASSVAIVSSLGLTGKFEREKAEVAPLLATSDKQQALETISKMAEDPSIQNAFLSNNTFNELLMQGFNAPRIDSNRVTFSSDDSDSSSSHDVVASSTTSSYADCCVPERGTLLGAKIAYCQRCARILALQEAGPTIGGVSSEGNNGSVPARVTSSPLFKVLLPIVCITLAGLMFMRISSAGSVEYQSSSKNTAELGKLLVAAGVESFLRAQKA